MSLLSSTPPGYQAPSTNKQTIGGLAVPGPQMRAITPGTSSFTQPSSFGQPAQAPTMTPYSNSPNISTLLRVLLGKTT